MALLSYFPLLFVTTYVQLIIISTLPSSSALPISHIASDLASDLSSKRVSDPSSPQPERLFPVARQDQDEETVDAALEKNVSYPYVLRGGSFNTLISVRVRIPETADISKIEEKYTVTMGKDVLPDFPGDSDITGITTEQSYYVSNVNLIFNRLPGKAELVVAVTDGQDFNFTQLHSFHLMGVVIYNVSEEGPDPVRLYTGRNAMALPLEIPKEGSGVHIQKFNASVYNGSPGVNSPLLNSDLTFSVPKKSPLKWNSTICNMVAGENDLSEDCSIAFSTDYTQFMVRTSHDLVVEDNLEDADKTISIIWGGIQSLEAEEGVHTEEEYEQNDIVNNLRIEVAGNDRNKMLAAEGGTVPTVVIVVTSLLLGLAVSTLVCCWCVWGKSRNMRMEAKVRAWVNGDISSLRTTAGRTVGVLEDPLSEGDAALMAAEKNGALQRQEYMCGGMESQGGGSAGENDLHTFDAKETDGMDGLVPLDRLSEDKSVTKLVLPRGRGMRRGVELEGSTDGGSVGTGRAGGSSDVDGRADSGSSGRRRDTGYSGQGGGTETGLESSTEATTEPTGTMIVDDGQGDSSNRDGVEAAIDRVRQVDLLLGPASRGIVGRNGEPILGRDSLEDVDAMSKKGPSGPESGILTLSTLS